MTNQKQQPSHAFIHWVVRPLLWLTAIYSGANAIGHWQSAAQTSVVINAANGVER